MIKYSSFSLWIEPAFQVWMRARKVLLRSVLTDEKRNRKGLACNLYCLEYLLSVIFCVPFLIFNIFVLPPFEDNGLLFCAPDVPLLTIRSCFVNFVHRSVVLSMNL